MHGQPTAFFIDEADPATEARAEDTVFLNQMRDARLPLIGPPAGHGHHEESNRGDIHDGGSLPHPLNVELETASAEKWDTTSAASSCERSIIAGRRDADGRDFRRTRGGLSGSPNAIVFNQDVHLRLKRSDPLQMKVEHSAHLDQQILDAFQSRGDRPDHRRHDRQQFDIELLLRRHGARQYSTT
jgi:hypothetical protein